jgi:hypothetical protein
MKKYKVTISTEIQEIHEYTISASTAFFAEIAALAEFTQIYDESIITDITTKEVE